MAVSFKTTATSLGTISIGTLYRVDLGALGLSNVRSLIIDDNGQIDSSIRRFSGLDLDFVKISSTLTSNPSTAATLVGQNLFNFTTGTTLKTGYITPGIAGESGSWSTNGLYGTFAQNQLNNGFATLGIADGNSSTPQGFVSLGEAGQISFTLTSSIATAGNYLYFSTANGTSSALVSISDDTNVPGFSSLTLYGTGNADYIAMQVGMNANIGQFGDTIDGGAGNDTIYGGAGDDLLLGGSGNDVLFGQSGIDQIYGGTGDDYIQADDGDYSILSGDDGDDLIYGGVGNDYFVGGNGNDTMVGGGGINSMYGGAGNDYIVSGDGANNVIDGGAGANSLWGGGGNDYAVGGEGADIIVMFGGDDYIFGNEGNDAIYAGPGTDYIYGNSGNDFIYTDDFGYSSKDYIYAGPGTGIDTVVDFKPGSSSDSDVIVMSTTAARSLAAVQAAATQSGLYTVIQVSTTDSVYLYNVRISQLTADNFIFL